MIIINKNNQIGKTEKLKARIKRKMCGAVFLTFAASALCGCADISHREFIYADDYLNDPSSFGGVGGDLLIVTDEAGNASHTADGTVGNGDIPDDHVSFTPVQQEFINSCYFMGDSICLGMGINGFVSHCSAKAGVAARNIEEFTFDVDGAQLAPLTALVNSNLNKFVFLMGSNDVNVESDEEYIKFYNSFLSKVEALCPNADIYVLSIPPVTESSTFCYNYQIDSFNLKLKEMITSYDSIKRHYVDISSYLKDEHGNLKEIYSSDNTVHLTKSAYLALLAGFCKEIGI